MFQTLTYNKTLSRFLRNTDPSYKYSKCSMVFMAPSVFPVAPLQVCQEMHLPGGGKGISVLPMQEHASDRPVLIPIHSNADAVLVNHLFGFIVAVYGSVLSVHDTAEFSM